MEKATVNPRRMEFSFSGIFALFALFFFLLPLFFLFLVIHEKLRGKHQALHTQDQRIHKVEHAADEGELKDLLVLDKAMAFFYFYFNFFIRLPDGYGVVISVFHHDAFHDSLAADV